VCAHVGFAAPRMTAARAARTLAGCVPYHRALTVRAVHCFVDFNYRDAAAFGWLASVVTHSCARSTPNLASHGPGRQWLDRELGLVDIVELLRR